MDSASLGFEVECEEIAPEAVRRVESHCKGVGDRYRRVDRVPPCLQSLIAREGGQRLFARDGRSQAGGDLTERQAAPIGRC